MSSEPNRISVVPTALAPQSAPMVVRESPASPNADLTSGVSTIVDPIIDPTPDVQRFFDEEPHEQLHGHEPLHAEELHDLLDADDDAEREREHHARVRRRRFALVAQLAVLGSVLLCTLALARVIAKSQTADAASRVVAPPTATATGSTTPTAAVPAAPPVTPVTGVTPVTPPPDPALAIATTALRAPAPLRDHTAARAERVEAQAALEIGDLPRAVRAAQRAVTYDPSEADGWLLLVAAQLELGHALAAHKALTSCAQLATRGPRGECVALLQTQPSPTPQ